METETAPGEVPRSASRYRTLRGKSISSPRVLDIFRDGGKPPPLPMSSSRSSSVYSIRAGNSADDEAPDVPPLPSYALTPKPVNIPPPPTFRNREDGGKRPAQAIQVENMPRVAASLQEKQHNHSPSPRVVKKKSSLLSFGKREVEPVPLPATPRSVEHKKHDLARLQPTFSTPQPKHKSSLLSLFSRARKASTTPSSVQPDTPSSVATTVFSRGTSLETASNTDSVKFSDPVEKSNLLSSPVAYQAPTLSMSFERRVAVRCLSSTINLPVSHETTSVDIMFMASTMMRHHINPACSVVVESYLMMGLERRLRRYERICDVMNSWDKDHENSLLILSCPAFMNDRDLDLDAVPNTDTAALGFTLQLHQSSRPGKWNKRWVTLMESGQMYAAKTPDARLGDAGTTQLCHMGDFDIYTPKEAEARQSIRPPKKFCYALKSQEKSMLFPDEENFVHFFSTDDAEVATQFYELVHGWRSWHLVSRKLALDRKLNAPAPKLSFDSNSNNNRNMNSNNGSDTSGEDGKSESEPSSATPSFRIGSFQPLLDIDNISKLAEEARKLMPPEPESEPEPEPAPAAADAQEEAIPPQPDFPPPATPVSKASDNLAVMTPLPPSPEMYHPSPPSKADGKLEEITSSSGDAFALDFDAAPRSELPEPKPEPKSWFPSAAEHTAKLRRESPLPALPGIRRPVTADPALRSGGSQRRANNTNLSINTQFLEPPPFLGSLGGAPKPSPNIPFLYKLPGTPMTATAPNMGGAGRFMPRSNSSAIGPSPSPLAGRQRSRSTIGPPPNRRTIAETLPPVPALPGSRPVKKGDAPIAAAMPVPLSVQARQSSPQVCPPLRPPPPPPPHSV